jgi:RNA polymerase sigma factor (sigma-70 family)
MGGNVEDSKDALSGIMIKAQEKLPGQAAKIRNLKGWLGRLAHNFCIDIYRVRKRGETNVNYLKKVVTDSLDLPGTEEASDRYLKSDEASKLVKFLILDLSTLLREPLVLRFYQNLPYIQIADRLNISTACARKRVQRARAILKGRLNDDPGDLSLPVDEHAPAPDVPAASGSALEAYQSEMDPATALTVRCVKVSLRSGLELDLFVPTDQKTKRARERVGTLERYVARHPMGWRKRLQLANLFHATGQWERAEREYRRVAEKSPRLLSVWLRLGEIYTLTGSEGEAEKTYDAALALARNPATRHYISGMMDLCRRRCDAAAGRFERAIREEPTALLPRRALGLAHLDSENPVGALHAFGKTLDHNAGDVVALSSSHEALVALERSREAEQCLKRILEVDPENVFALKRLADSRSGAGLVSGSEGRGTRLLIKTMARKMPESVLVADSTACYRAARGERMETIAEMRRFVERHPKNPHGWSSYAKWLFRKGDVEQASGAIVRALTLYKGDPDIYKEACRILAYAGRSDELRKTADEMLARFPARWSVWTAYGLALARSLNDPERACEVSSQGPRLQPCLPQPWFQYGLVLKLLGETVKAIAALEEGLKWATVDGSPYSRTLAAIWLSDCCLSLGQEKKAYTLSIGAKAAARDLIKLNPACGYYLQGRLSQASGDVAGAIDAYSNALRHHLWYPASSKAGRALSLLRRGA